MQNENKFSNSLNGAITMGYGCAKMLTRISIHNANNALLISRTEIAHELPANFTVFSCIDSVLK